MTSDEADPDLLSGTTLRVYRYLFRLGGPASLRDIQKGLGLSSPSVSEYHVRKLLESGLIREGDGGYVVDRRVWQNMIRVKRVVIPLRVVYVVFLASALLAMVVVFWESPAKGYVFGIVVMLVALGFSIYEVVGASRNRI